jgi:flagellar motor protein MotB
VLQAAGVREQQLDVVRGYAATRLRTPNDPLAPENRRISIVVRRAGEQAR